MFTEVKLSKLEKTNTNRFHLASYSVRGNQKMFSRHKNNNDNDKKGKNPHLQIETRSR